MDIQTHLSSFFTAIESDAQINASQISLYMVLVSLWNDYNNINPFPVQRRTIMQRAKISSRSTFNRNMRQLHNAGYIKYIPSFNPAVDSIVCISLAL